MSRSLIALLAALFALAVAAVPAAFAEGSHHRAVLVHGVCTQQSTSKLKLGREDRGIELEFQVDQNRNAVPWRVTLRRNGVRVAAFTARTHAPSGSFEIRRVIAGRLSSDRIRAIATRNGETCTAAGAAPRAGLAVDVSGHDVGDDHGSDS